MHVIEIENLTHDYQTGFWRKRSLRALDGLSLRVEAGEVFGFLGPNGAGKTTTFKILMRMLRPTAGEARILGQPLDDLRMRARIGYLPERPYFYQHLTARELLLYYGALCDLPRDRAARRAAELLDQVGLSDSADRRLRKFSKACCSAWAWRRRSSTTRRFSFWTSRCRTWTRWAAARLAS